MSDNREDIQTTENNDDVKAFVDMGGCILRFEDDFNDIFGSDDK